MRGINILLFVAISLGYSNSVDILLKNKDVIIYSFSNKPRMTFSNGNLILKASSAVMSYSMGNVQKISFSEFFENTYSNEITINDDKLIAFSNEANIENCIIHYVRTFSDLEWHPLYIPFELSYSDWSDFFEIASIRSIQQIDFSEENGVAQLVIEPIVAGSTRPNQPYLIRAKSVGTKVITIENATLFKTNDREIFPYLNSEYSLVGTYQTYQLNETSEYYLDNKNLVAKKTNYEKISPFRWFLGLNQSFPEQTICFFSNVN